MDKKNMKAKDLIQGNPINEAEDAPPPPGSTSGPERPMRRPGRTGMLRGSQQRSFSGAGGPQDPDMPPDIMAMMGSEASSPLRTRAGEPGGPGGPKGFFNPKEVSQLKDILIMMLAQLAGSQSDGAIGQKLMAGQELEPGELQHILDECRALKLPESHTPILQKIYQKLSGSGG